MSEFLLLTIGAGSFAGWVMAIRVYEQRRQLANLRVFELRFPRGLATESVEAFFAGLSGLLPPWWKRWMASPVVTMETEASENGIAHRLLTSARYAHRVENALQAHLPAVRYSELPTVPVVNSRWGASYRLNTPGRTLRVDAPSLSLALLTSLQPLRSGETIVVQWQLTAAGPVGPARHGQAPVRWWWPRTDDGTRVDGEAVSALKAKQAAPLLLASARIGVDAKPARRRDLVHRVESAWHASRAPGVHLNRRWLAGAWVARTMRARTWPLVGWPVMANAQELSGLTGIPTDAEQIPGLVLGGCRQLAVSPLVPTRGLVLAESTFPGSHRPIALDVQGQLRHLHAVGPTGTGKSTLLLNLICQDMAAGHGITVLDPKGDLVADVLARVPDHRRRDVIVLDASDDIAPVGLNPLRAGSANGSEVMVENLVSLMHSLWSFSWGPRTDDILRAALMTLSAQPGMTLVEVAPLLLEESFRRRFIGRLNDPVGLESFWGWYQGLSDAERATVVAAPLNKLRSFTMRPRMRRILGQSNPKLNLAEVLRDGRILLVNLASGLLGEDAAALTGALVVAQLWHATTARSGLPASKRRLHVAYLDEFQHFLHLPTPVATVLAEARGLGLGLVLAHQHLHQLPAEVREGVLANARSRVVFQSASSDARAWSKELGGGLTPDDIQGLGKYEVVSQVFASGQVCTPATGRTLPPPPETTDGEAIRAASRQRYGRPVAEIDAEINARSSVRSSAPVGNRRRTQRSAGHGGRP